MNSALCTSVAMCSCFQMPRSLVEMPRSGVAAAASVITSPAPPCARQPRCTRCQSFANPSSDEYSHIGETPMRFGNTTDRSLKGEKRGWLIDRFHYTGCAALNFDAECVTDYCTYPPPRSTFPGSAPVIFP